MQDRFKFNAIVTGYYDIDTPDEYLEFEPQIYLENVDIWSGGDIGVSRDDLELAIKNQYPNIEKSQFNQIMKFFEDNSNSSDNEAYLTILPHKIIQCTGLKDKNGNLIYELDHIKYQNNEYKVEKDKFLGITLTNILNGDIIVMDDIILFNCEVIGNEFESNTKI